MQLLFSSVFQQSIVKFFVSSHGDVLYQSKFYLDADQIQKDCNSLNAITCIKEYFDILVEGRFINLRLKNNLALGSTLLNLYQKKFFNPENKSTHVLIDCFSVNVGKHIHYGHLRSGNLGNVLKRLLKAIGHQVSIDVHLGDYGKNLGIFMAAHQNKGIDVYSLSTSELHKLYLAADPDLDTSDRLLDLSAAQKMQRHLKALAIAEIGRISDVLGYEIDLYNGEFEYVANANKYLEILQPFMETAHNRIKTKTGIYVTRSNGTYLYAFADICALYNRHSEFNKIIYVVDKRQSLHFASVFAFYNLHINTRGTRAIHLPYGMVMDSEKEILKSRGTAGSALVAMQNMAQKHGLDIEYMRIALTLNEMRHLVDSDYILNDLYLEKIFIDAYEFVSAMQVLTEATSGGTYNVQLFSLILKIYEHMHLSACAGSIKGIFLPFKMLMDIIIDRKVLHCGVAEIKLHVQYIVKILFNFAWPI